MTPELLDAMLCYARVHQPEAIKEIEQRIVNRELNQGPPNSDLPPDKCGGDGTYLYDDPAETSDTFEFLKAQKDALIAKQEAQLEDALLEIRRLVNKLNALKEIGDEHDEVHRENALLRKALEDAPAMPMSWSHHSLVAFVEAYERWNKSRIPETQPTSNGSLEQG